MFINLPGVDICVTY